MQAVTVIGPGLPGQLTVTDDRGTTSTGQLLGRRQRQRMAWPSSRPGPPLAPETAWIEVLGERIELPARRPRRAEVRVEPLPDPDPARGYLWARLASLAEFHVCRRDGDVHRGARRGRDAGARRPGHRPRCAPWRRPRSPGRGAAPGSDRGAPGAVAVHAGPARPGGGPQGLVVAGATTPPFDGITLAILAVHSDGRVVLPPTSRPSPACRTGTGRSGAVDTPLLAWWAADDRGHHYLGRQGSGTPARTAPAGRSSSGPRWTRPPGCSTSCPPR